MTVRFLLITSDSDPKAVLVYFPGGGGALVDAEGRLRFRQFISVMAQLPLVTAALDMPSDHPDGVAGTNPFRASKAHAEDAKKVIDALRQKWSRPLFLIGHSGGTTSVAYLGAALANEDIAGLVLLAAISRHPPGGVSLANLPLDKITVPVLFVHHRDDLCVSFEGVRQQLSRLTQSPKVDFIEVLGGDPSKAHHCSPFAARQGPPNYGHFFGGREHEVFRAIAHWVTGMPVPGRIGP